MEWAKVGPGVQDSQLGPAVSFVRSCVLFKQPGKHVGFAWSALRALYFCWKGDLKARKEVHGFTRWYSCTLFRASVEKSFDRLDFHNVPICLVRRTPRQIVSLVLAAGCVTFAWPRSRPRTPTCG